MMGGYEEDFEPEDRLALVLYNRPEQPDDWRFSRILDDAAREIVTLREREQRLEAALRKYSHPGHLQTFEDRERFRAEAARALSTPTEQCPECEGWGHVPCVEYVEPHLPYQSAEPCPRCNPESPDYRQPDPSVDGALEALDRINQDVKPRHEDYHLVRRALRRGRVPEEPPASFVEHMRRNYPSSSTVHDPDWHASRIWRAVRRAITEDSGPGKREGPDQPPKPVGDNPFA